LGEIVAVYQMFSHRMSWPVHFGIFIEIPIYAALWAFNECVTLFHNFGINNLDNLWASTG